MIRIFLTAGLIAAVALPAFADESVRGHVTKKGVYVPPHQRTAPNDTKRDNYSSKPNVNPHTGKRGTVDPYAPKSTRRR